MTEMFHDLRFETRARRFPRRAIPVSLACLGLVLLWQLVPAGTLFWLLMLFMAVAVWMASYGWRPALATLHNLLHQLEQF